MKKFVIYITALLLFAFSACAQSKAETQFEVLLDLCRDIYGNAAIVQLPNGQYCRMGIETSCGKVWRYQLFPIMEKAEDDIIPYEGDDLTYYSAKEQYSVGEEIVIYIACAEELDLHFDKQISLEMMIGDEWYSVLNEGFGTDVDYSKHGNITYRISEQSLAHNHVLLSEDGEYFFSDELYNVTLPAGFYRFYDEFTVYSEMPYGDDMVYTICVEFEIVD